MSLTSEQLIDFARRLTEQTELWRPAIRHRDDERVYQQIWDDPDVNAWVICWSTDQDTGFHDHDDSAAAIAVINGSVREDRLTLTATPRSRELRAGTIFTVEPAAIHRVLHSGDGPAITIHAYSPPLARTGSYRILPDGQLRRDARPAEEELRAEALAV